MIGKNKVALAVELSIKDQLRITRSTDRSVKTQEWYCPASHE